MSGTDASAITIVPGFALHDEFGYMVEAGFTPYEVLRMSTYNPAKFLGQLDEFGTLQKGKRADLLLLDANPLNDIANTRKIAGVMTRGRWFASSDLTTMLHRIAERYR